MVPDAVLYCAASRYAAWWRSIVGAVPPAESRAHPAVARPLPGRRATPWSTRLP